MSKWVMTGMEMCIRYWIDFVAVRYPGLIMASEYLQLICSVFMTDRYCSLVLAVEVLNINRNVFRPHKFTYK
jgi:hypothetical protein